MACPTCSPHPSDCFHFTVLPLMKDSLPSRELSQFLISRTIKMTALAGLLFRSRYLTKEYHCICPVARQNIATDLSIAHSFARLRLCTPAQLAPGARILPFSWLQRVCLPPLKYRALLPRVFNGNIANFNAVHVRQVTSSICLLQCSSVSCHYDIQSPFKTFSSPLDSVRN